MSKDYNEQKQLLIFHHDSWHEVIIFCRNSAFKIICHRVRAIPGGPLDNQQPVPTLVSALVCRSAYPRCFERENYNEPVWCPLVSSVSSPEGISQEINRMPMATSMFVVRLCPSFEPPARAPVSPPRRRR